MASEISSFRTQISLHRYFETNKQTKKTTLFNMRLSLVEISKEFSFKCKSVAGKIDVAAIGNPTSFSKDLQINPF